MNERGGGSLITLEREEALQLLASVPYGRVVFTERAMPAIRPVNHLVDETGIIIRTHEGSAVLGRARSKVVVAYEADAIDPVPRSGWSVIATGTAETVSDAEEAAGYRGRLQPWVAGEMDHVIRIRPEFVWGFRLVAAIDAAAAE